MADIESMVYTAVSQFLKQRFPSLSMDSITTYSPSKFPFLSIEESDNYSLQSARDTSTTDYAQVVAYEANVWSNKQGGKKKECKAILANLDEVMASLGFTRTAKNPANTGDPSRYRMFARYTAVVRGETIYRR